jgi:hypothetical protein
MIMPVLRAFQLSVNPRPDGPIALRRSAPRVARPRADPPQCADSFLYQDQKALSVFGNEVTVSAFLILNIDVEEWPRLASDDLLTCEL